MNSKIIPSHNSKLFSDPWFLKKQKHRTSMQLDMTKLAAKSHINTQVERLKHLQYSTCLKLECHSQPPSISSCSRMRSKIVPGQQNPDCQLSSTLLYRSDPLWPGTEHSTCHCVKNATSKHFPDIKRQHKANRQIN